MLVPVTTDHLTFTKKVVSRYSNAILHFSFSHFFHNTKMGLFICLKLPVYICRTTQTEKKLYLYAYPATTFRKVTQLNRKHQRHSSLLFSSTPIPFTNIRIICILNHSAIKASPVWTYSLLMRGSSFVQKLQYQRI